MTRSEIFDYLRGISSPWWGRLDEVTFLEGLYGRDRPTSENIPGGQGYTLRVRAVPSVHQGLLARC
ncbi:hypothetical protein ABZS83_37650 [Streptomyces sp. NPDC005426]|uniref:hypothetical protein n=1 Tax=Streptomyces sp. NPDC005426 TaxID=3155344 RepID=UPI00339ED7E0